MVSRYFIYHFVQFRELGIIEEYTFKKTILERGPGLDCYIIYPTVIEYIAIPNHCPVKLGVHIYSKVYHATGHNAELKLIDLQCLFHIFFKQFHLRRILVADSKMQYRTFCIKIIVCGGNLLWFHKGIGTMEQKVIKPVGSQPFKGIMHGLNYIIF